MKKIVLKLDLHDDKDKQKAMKVVSVLQGRIDSIGMDMKELKMTVIGSVDPVKIVMKLRKFWHTNVISIGPAKEEKKEEPKKEEPPKQQEGEAKEEKKEEKKEEPKEEPKKEEEKKKEEEPKEEAKKEDEPKKEQLAVPLQHHEQQQQQQQMMMMMADQFSNYPPYRAYYNPYMTTHYHYVPNPQDQNPNSCSIM